MHTAAALLGIVSLALWSASFVLMLRLKVLERLAGGLDRLYWWHHVCGVMAYLTLLGHPLALAAAAFAGVRATGGAAWSAAASVLTPPGYGLPIQAGWAALALLMAMMVATFLLPLTYSRWRAVHLASVPAFALGAAHAWAFAGPQVRAAIAVFSLISILSLVWRLAMVRAWVRAHPHHVVRVAHPGPGLLDLDLEPVGAPLCWTPGQFVFVAFFSSSQWRGCGEYHPYTIAGEAPSAPGGLRLLIRALGDCTTHLQTLRTGVGASVQGPYGSFLARRDPRRPQLWIAGGIGLTPFMAALEQLRSAPGRRPGRVDPDPPAIAVDLVHVHGPDDVMADACLPGSAGLPPGVRITPIESAGDPDQVWQALLAATGSPVRREVFICGPQPLVDALHSRLVAAGVLRQDIHSEKFDFR